MGWTIGTVFPKGDAVLGQTEDAHRFFHALLDALRTYGTGPQCDTQRRLTVCDPKVVTAVQRTIDAGGSMADATGATMGLLQIGAGAVNAASSDQANAQLQTTVVQATRP